MNNRAITSCCPYTQVCLLLLSKDFDARKSPYSDRDGGAAAATLKAVTTGMGQYPAQGYVGDMSRTWSPVTFLITGLSRSAKGRLFRTYRSPILVQNGPTYHGTGNAQETARKVNILLIYHHIRQVFSPPSGIVWQNVWHRVPVLGLSRKYPESGRYKLSLIRKG